MTTFPLTQVSLNRKLKFSQLMTFDFVLKTGSFVGAANSMGVTQPSVTKTIQELEDFFGTSLFQRSNRGAVPTEFATMLGRHAKGLLADARHLTDEINSFRTGESGHVIVGTLMAGAAKLLPLAISRFRREHPNVSLEVREGTSASLFPAVSSGEVDIVVGRLPEHGIPLVETYALRHEVLVNETLCVVVGNRHRLAGKKDVKLSDLMSDEWILPLKESPVSHSVERLFQDSGQTLPIRHIRSLSIMTNVGLLMETDMVALLPRAAALQFASSRLLTVLEFSTAVDFGPVGYSVRADKEIQPACLRFIECLREISG